MLCFLTIDKTKIIIQKKIGEGATSTVYQGKYNDKIVAIKELKDNYHEFKEYFNYELTILQKLKHNLCFIEIFGMSQIENNYYLIMEFFDYDLSNYIHQNHFWKRSIQYKNKYIPESSSYYYFEDDFYWNYMMNKNEKKHITKQLLNCINELHKLNIVHGDLKSENFVYMNNILKLIDFNTATHFKDKNNVKIECVYGTIGYTSPEQYENRLSYKSDIYSICIIILELWCGHIWFDKDDFKGCRNEVLKSLRLLEKNEINLSKILRKNISLQEKKRNKIQKLIVNCHKILLTEGIL